MDFVFEKINTTMEHKNHLIDIYSVGKKIHETVDCVIQPCDCSQYLDDISILIENMENRQELTDNEKDIFFDTSKKHHRAFLLFNQINKKFGAEIYQLQKDVFLTAISFQVEKIKLFFSVLNKIEKLESKLYVLEKAFV